MCKGLLIGINSQRMDMIQAHMLHSWLFFCYTFYGNVVRIVTAKEFEWYQEEKIWRIN